MNFYYNLFIIYVLFIYFLTIILCADINNKVNNNNNSFKNSTINNSVKNKREKSNNDISNSTKSSDGKNSALKKDVLTSSTTNLSKSIKLINTTSISSPVKRKVATTNSKNQILDEYNCPKQGEFQWFPFFCGKHDDCKHMGKQYRCCKQFNNKRCVKGVAKPIEEPKHSPLLGLIPRRCPKEPLAELFWDIQTCNTDLDCWPRVCCPDGRKKYCRTANPDINALPFPVARQLAYPIQSASGYLQCTAPPPPIYDLHPKRCNNTWDCFPNVCCQESGKKHCRPPRRSLLALVAGMAQRFNTGLIKQWTDNLVIR